MSLDVGVPGELREKLNLYYTPNKILRDGGYVDVSELTTSLAALKQQLNYLLNEVVGIEHSIDSVHTYDDSNLKTQLTNLTTTVGTNRADINTLQTRTNTLEGSISGIEHDSGLRLKDTSLVDVMAYNSETPTIYSRLRTLPTGATLVCNTGTGLPGQINISNVNGVDIESSLDIYVGKQNGHHYLRITSDANELSDVNGLKITYDNTGITFTSYDDTLSKTIAWA
jgi:cell division protein FtsB